MNIKETESVGLVQTHYYTFGEAPHEFVLESGKKLGPVTIAYETYGRLNEDKSNAILIVHALTGDAHVAGKNDPSDEKPGWWDSMVGPGKCFDTNQYFVICSNILGGCKGTTGPSSINPKTKKPYGLSFPVITITDMVQVQKRLIDHLGIKTLLAVAGGSMGGMQVLDWALYFPDTVRSAVVIASTARLSPQAIAFDEVGRHAIASDPQWENGNYYGNEVPAVGLAIARMIGHITYLSEESMMRKFGREKMLGEADGAEFTRQFAVGSYLHYKGDSFVKRFDANSYLYITRAMDEYDLEKQYGSLVKAFNKVKSKFLVISFTSDWLFPSSQSKEIVRALMTDNKDVTYCEVNSSYGHDAFLLETEKISKIIASFLDNV
ncbi:MAG: homoserine O-acetyltransferase [Elusimicrobia bacterium]|nr:homoserine O-acetyltransferase [Elusimicrobiota bacterium]